MPGTVRQHAFDVLKSDHNSIKELLSDFKESESDDEKAALFVELRNRLSNHAVIEQEYFYPLLRSLADDVASAAEEEHGLIDVLLTEMEDVEPDDPAFEGKFEMLAAAVKRHINEEEREIFPQIEEAGIDFESVGKQLAERKRELEDTI